VGPHESRAKKLVYAYLIGGGGICVLIVIGIAIWGLPATGLRIALNALLAVLLAGFALMIWRMRLCRYRDLMEGWIERLKGGSQLDHEATANDLERFIESLKAGGRARRRALLTLERARNAETRPGIRSLMTSILDQFD
jgi:hypothetical protein